MRLWITVAAIALGALTFGQLNYIVHVQPETNNLRVTLTVPKAEQGVKLQIPNWAPGSYRLVDNFKLVRNLKAYDPSGRELSVEVRMDKLRKEYGDETPRRVAENDLCTWVVPGAPSVKVEYDITQNVVDGAVHWSGPSTYIYPVGRTQERCVLDLRLPDGWKAYTGLNERRQSPHVYDAPTYDVLADNPVSTGDLLVDTYQSRGKTHTIVMRGRAKANVDRAYLVKVCKHVTDAQTHFFGGAPYDKYIWHFNVNDAPDGAGGLEHLSSTQISLASGVGPRAVSVISHEFFHLWNVKRIRSRVLGPFDYTKLPETGALWWLEGVTDYYAHTLLYRYGWWGQDEYFRDVISNLTSVRNNPARLEVSPYASSMRVSEAANGRGNSQGYRISYYDRGWLCGMVLDIELQARTGGKHTLDDVMLALWTMNAHDQPGFEEDEIRRQLVRFGGMEMGWFYDQVIMKPGDMPVEAALAKCGLTLAEQDEPYSDIGFAAIAGQDGLRVARPTGPATGKLNAGDVITAIDGKPVGSTRREVAMAAAELIAKAKVGTTLRLGIRRGDGITDVELVPVAGTRKVKKIVTDPKATAEQRQLAEVWLRRIRL